MDFSSSMASSSLSSSTFLLSSKLRYTTSNPHVQFNSANTKFPGKNCFSIKCESNDFSSPDKVVPSKSGTKLEIGSPIIVVEAPHMVKTAASVPCLIINSGLVKPGDVGRIVSRKPKDVWAVRLTVGTYLLDGKYFKPLELNDQ